MEMQDMEPSPATSRVLQPPSYLPQMDFYANIPVPASTRSIRLLTLQISPNSDTTSSLVGQVFSANLDSFPSFTVLSYVWGEKADPSHTIILQPQGLTLEITASCYGALAQLGKRHPALTIWVDSICINQLDDDEKASQIRLMTDIYSLAERAYVYLGPGDKESDRAMDYLKRSAKMMTRLPFEEMVAPNPVFQKGRYVGGKMYSTLFRTLKNMPSRLKLLQYGSKASNNVSLDSLLSRSWIYRAWTFQEIILATNPIVLCGEKYLSWEDIINTLFISRGQMGKKDIGRLPHHFPLPVSADVLHNWRFIIDLWLRFHRIPLRGALSTTTDEEVDECTPNNRTKLQFLDRANKVASIIRVSIACLLLLVYSAGSTYGIYAASKAAGKANHNQWWIWFIFLGAIMCSISVFVIRPYLLYVYRACWFAVIGVNQDWNKGTAESRADQSNLIDRAAQLNGIRATLQERSSSVPHDMAFSVLSILQSLGPVDVQLDYQVPFTETFQQLFIALVKLHPQGLMLLCDAGCPEFFNGTWTGPSWVPNWTARAPSSWMSSKKLPDKIFLDGFAQSLKCEMSGSSLLVNGYKVGTITFSGKHAPVTSRTTRLAIQELCRWYEVFRRQKLSSTSSSIYKSTASAMFAVLEGVAPQRQSITYQEWVSHYPSTTPPGRMRTYTHPPYKAPYDFSDRIDEFTDFMELFDILAKTFPPAVEGTINSCLAELDETAWSLIDQEIAENPRAAKFAQRYEDLMLRDQRTLFIAQNDNPAALSLAGSTWIGTGPPHVAAGDEIFRFSGIPIPMVLRPIKGGEGSNVVGAVLVHGLMHERHQGPARPISLF